MTTASRSPRRWLLRLLLGLGFAALVAMGMAIILIAVPMTRRLIVVGLAQWMLGGRLESLAVDLDIQPNLRWLFTLLVILPVGFGLTRMVTARRFSSAARGLALVAGTLLAVGGLTWWQTRHFNFDAQGRPVVYLSYRREGVHKSYSPGIDRVTGRLKEAVTPARALWLSELVRQPVREVDPAVETNWFDAATGEPNLWYVELGTNRWQFYNRPHFHQQLRIQVSPVTPELMARWQADHDRQVAAAEAVRRQHEAEAKAAAEQKAREERERAEKEKREEHERAEQHRQTDLRIKAEAEARAKLEVARQEREEKQRREQVKKREQDEAAAQAKRLAEEHQRQVNERRIREATADPYSLDQWDPAKFVSGVFPNLEAQHSNASLFDDEYAGRRFHFHDRVEKVEGREGTVEFAATAYGKMDLRLAGLFKVGSAGGFKRGHDVDFVGTVQRVETSCSPNGSLVTLWLSGMESLIPLAVPVLKVVESKPVVPPVTVVPVNPSDTVVFKPVDSRPVSLAPLPSSWPVNDRVEWARAAGRASAAPAGAPLPGAVVWPAPAPVYQYWAPPAPPASGQTPARVYGYGARPPHRGEDPGGSGISSGAPVYRYGAPPVRVVWRRGNYAPLPGVPVAPAYVPLPGVPSRVTYFWQAPNRR